MPYLSQAYEALVASDPEAAQQLAEDVRKAALRMDLADPTWWLGFNKVDPGPASVWRALAELWRREVRKRAAASN